jgi:hypothetical protein
MAMMTVPHDSTPMYSTLDVVLFNQGRGRMPLEGFQESIYPGQYVASSPPPRPPLPQSGGSFSSAVAATAPPKTAASTLWPNLK